MSKVASYLQEHILGEVSINKAVLEAFSTDGSVLEIMPEMVIYPRVSNDIRKVARFAWQLAEKGHVLPITARGAGSDQTGAAIGKGIILVLPAHMNKIYELETKQKLIRVQPGLNSKALNDALMLHGMGIPALPASAAYSTIGGAVANNASGPLSGRYGDMSAWVHQLEVVLASGDVLQTGRISKRELSRKKGKQTFEGEIYRSLDNLIDDNKQLILDMAVSTVRNNVGYSSIAQVKQKDGSFDLTPLFVGSQGTLGIISEMIMKTDYISAHKAVAIAAFSKAEAARDALDQLNHFAPSTMEYFEGDVFEQAKKQNKSYDFYTAATENGEVEAVIIMTFDDFSERARQRKLKKVSKLLNKPEITLVTADGEASEPLLAVREVTSYLLAHSEKDISSPPLFDGAYVPKERFEDFAIAVKALAEKHHVSLALHGRAIEHIYFARPALQMSKVGDKQKLFKLLDEYANLVSHHSGHLIGEAGEGRLKAKVAHKELDDETKKLFADIKTIFDPFDILNPEVKQAVDIKQLVSNLRSDYDTSSWSDHSPHN